MSDRSDPVPSTAPPGDTPRTAAQLFVDCLENEGVEFVFGIPGEETLDVSEALDRSQLITFVPTRHEQGAAFMADAYGRLTGRPGVCLATLGPGATNLATGVGDATLDHAPLVALTGQTGLAGMHKETHQFIDVVDMLRPMTKWNTRIHHPRMVAEAVRKAFNVAAAEKPGATHLELPEDVMETLTAGTPLPRGPQAMVEADPVSLLRAAEVIQGARRPVVLAGNGVVRQDAAPALRALCDQTGLHAVTTFMGKGVLDASDPHFLFTAGLARQDYPQGLLGQADLVVAVGYDMIEWPPSAWNPEGRQRIVCIDTVAPEIDAHFVPEVELIGDLSRILYQLAGLLEGKEVGSVERRPYQRAFRRVLDAGTDDDFPVKPQRVLRDLREVLAPGDVLVSDVGVHKLWVGRFWEAREPNTVLISNGFAAMGFGLPASIAAALVHRGRSKVVCITGDGGFLMNLQELETARRLGLPFVVLVWTDGGYGLIEMHQRRKFGRIAGTRFDNPDLVALARSFGVEGLRAEKAGDVKPLLARALRHPGPVVVDIPIDYAENDKLAVDLWQLAPEALS
ncbi:MAG TPA: acetolactate synthase large subunit [Thermoleophilia bacterium]|nr:acetolactate synthase large subunit [Thermoleophilia bacterium]HQH21364.1 acetolactate synthase large subunit [Thermoleophilia bacterium]